MQAIQHMKTDIANTYVVLSSVLCPLEITESSEERSLRESGGCSVTEKQVWSREFCERRASLSPPI